VFHYHDYSGTSAQVVSPAIKYAVRQVGISISYPDITYSSSASYHGKSN
jgi:hypothetical protein